MRREERGGKFPGGNYEEAREGSRLSTMSWINGIWARIDDKELHEKRKMNKNGEEDDHQSRNTVEGA